MIDPNQFLILNHQKARTPLTKKVAMRKNKSRLGVVQLVKSVQKMKMKKKRPAKKIKGIKKYPSAKEIANPC